MILIAEIHQIIMTNLVKSPLIVVRDISSSYCELTQRQERSPAEKTFFFYFILVVGHSKEI